VVGRDGGGVFCGVRGSGGEWLGVKRRGTRMRMRMRRVNRITGNSVARRVTAIDHYRLKCPTKTIAFKAESLES
jgi:hypothetical protein